MPAVVTFTVPGRPYAKKRPRFSRRIGRAFDPAENAHAEAQIGTIALPHFAVPHDKPVRVEVRAVFACPASWSKKKRAAQVGGPHCQKPDGDNILKAVKDALNRIAWRDDGQVFDARVSKAWGDRDETVIVVEVLP